MLACVMVGYRFRCAYPLLALLAVAAAACSANEPQKRNRGEAILDDNDYSDVGDAQAPDSIEDGGTFEIGAHPSTSDGGSVRRGADAGPSVACTGTLKAGDLVVVEVMVSSRAGSGDDGEWVEIINTRECKLDVTNVKVESPRGTVSTDVDSVTLTASAIGEKIVLEPYESVVVADSNVATKNHGLPGRVFSWKAVDVLKNSGDTVKITAPSGTVLDNFTYPAFKADQLPTGTSFSFPDGCKLSDRYVAGSPTVWTKRWSVSFASYATGFKGTPNGPNTDVACPTVP